MLTKILQSFEQGLPVLDIKPRNDPYYKISSNAKSTIMVKPVPVFFHEATTNLVNLATERLQTIKEIDEYIPGVEKTHLLSVEVDVARASAQHLVYPINMVLPELFQGIDILCHSEVTQGQHSRFYVRWAIARPGQPELTFAILEYKREGVLRWEDFELALCTEKDVVEQMDGANQRDAKTLLEDNAETISKQAREYSTTCKDIAVFD